MFKCIPNLLAHANKQVVLVRNEVILVELLPMAENFASGVTELPSYSLMRC